MAEHVVDIPHQKYFERYVVEKRLFITVKNYGMGIDDYLDDGDFDPKEEALHIEAFVKGSDDLDQATIEAIDKAVDDFKRALKAIGSVISVSVK